MTKNTTMNVGDIVLRKSYTKTQKIVPGMIIQVLSDGTAVVIWKGAFDHWSAGTVNYTSTIKLSSLELFSEEALLKKDKKRNDKKQKDMVKSLKTIADVSVIDWVAVCANFDSRIQEAGWVEVEYYRNQNGQECGRHKVRLSDLGRTILSSNL